MGLGAHRLHDQLGLLGYIALSLLATQAGAGIHMWDMRLSAFFGLLHV